MWGKLLKSACIETINEEGELCKVWFPKHIYVELNVSDRQNQGLVLNKEILAVIEEMKGG